MTGGDLIADVLAQWEVPYLFTLCGGHISPILVSAEKRGVRVVDVRDEVTAAFAADGVARLTGRPGVAAVTAGPGCANTITALKNAQMAQSPMVLLGGATGTILKGRGSLQDIDQIALMEPHVKWIGSAERVKELVPLLEEALEEARHGVPGPVFLECPVDLLYEESLVREIYGVGKGSKRGRSVSEMALRWYLKRHLKRIFKDGDSVRATPPPGFQAVRADSRSVRRVGTEIEKAKRPVLLIGSQATLRATEIQGIANAVDLLGLPVYLSGMARGLLGADHERHMRHKRRQALKEADLVLLAGVPSDFRLDYGRHIPRRTKLVSVNLSDHDLSKNRKPTIGLIGDPGSFLQDLAAELGSPGARLDEWIATLQARDAEREEEIAAQASEETEHLNPIRFLQRLDAALDDDSTLVADGGDFVATASYVVRPRGPLRWLDPGVFGTLGVGGGFALAAKLVRPASEVWILYGDGSAGYSLAEFDTYVRHELPVIAVVGNDAGWTQIAREQVEILGTPLGTELRHTDYHLVAEGYGGRGLLLDDPADTDRVLAEAKEIARGGTPVLVNVLIGKTDFRKGSISM